MMGSRLSIVWVLLALTQPGLGQASSGQEMAYARLIDGYWQLWTYDMATGTHRQITTSPVDKRDPVWSPDGEIVFRTHGHELYRVEPGGREVPIHRRIWPALDPAWAPDRKRIALSGLRTEIRDQSAIWILSDEGKTRRILSRGPGLRSHPTWSPDGKWLIYVRSFGAEGSALMRVASDGTNEEELLRDASHNAHPQWSPDGRKLVYATNRSGDYELVVRDLESGAEQILASAPGLDVRPCWSPDGRRIAFSTYRRGRMEIWTIGADGSGAAPLFSVPDEVSDPAWR